MLDDIKKTLWATADKLRANMDAAEYKHLVLGLIFLKYVSDTFTARRAEVAARLQDPEDEFYYGEASADDLAAELEDRDYYKSANVFWVPDTARWETLRAQAKSPEIGKHIDAALNVIEGENPKLKGILDKRYARAQLPDGKLGELVDLVSTIGFGENPPPPATCWARCTNTSWACSPAPRASAAGSSTRPPASSRPWWPCWRPTTARCTTRAAGPAACLCRAKNSSKPTAARSATCPSTGKRPTPPPGAWPP
jgi:hypothetical protein